MPPNMRAFPFIVKTKSDSDLDTHFRVLKWVEENIKHPWINLYNNQDDPKSPIYNPHWAWDMNFCFQDKQDAALLFFVVFDRGLVKTAVPNRGQFDRHVREALRERAAKLSSKPSPTVCVQSMRLPPRHLRPKRNEAALARLKAKKALEEEDY